MKLQKRHCTSILLLALISSLLITSCKKEEIPPATIINQQIIDEKVETLASIESKVPFLGTNTWGDSSRLLFQIRVYSNTQPTEVKFEWIVKPLSSKNLLLTQDSFSMASRFIPTNVGEGFWQYSYISLRNFKQYSGYTGTLYTLGSFPTPSTYAAFNSQTKATIKINSVTHVSPKKDIPPSEMLWGTPWIK
jgi:hypothetical protein